MKFNPDLSAVTATRKHKATRLHELRGWRGASIWVIETLVDGEQFGVFDIDGKCIRGDQDNLINTPRTVTLYVHWYTDGAGQIHCQGAAAQKWEDTGLMSLTRKPFRTDGPFEIEIPPDVDL